MNGRTCDDMVTAVKSIIASKGARRSRPPKSGRCAPLVHDQAEVDSKETVLESNLCTPKVTIGNVDGILVHKVGHEELGKSFRHKWMKSKRL